MRPQIFLAIISTLIVPSLFTSGCGATITIAFGTPTITPIIATTIPVGNIPPTLTPFPSIAPATVTNEPVPVTGPTSTSTVQPTGTTTPIASVTSQPIVPTLTQPPPPTKVVLPQLPVFDKDGQNMEGQALGISVPKSLMSFQVIACSPDCKSKGDGSGIVSVDFEFYKGTTHKRADLKGKKPVYKTTEHNKPYCAFGGDNPCPIWVFSEHSGKWPNGANIDSGDYTLLLRALGDNKNNGFWTSVVNFSIQR